MKNNLQSKADKFKFVFKLLFDYGITGYDSQK